MVSNALLFILAGLFVVVGASACFEGNLPRGLYGFSAALLQASIWWGMR